MYEGFSKTESYRSRTRAKVLTGMCQCQLRGRLVCVAVGHFGLGRSVDMVGLVDFGCVVMACSKLHWGITETYVGCLSRRLWLKRRRNLADV